MIDPDFMIDPTTLKSVCAERIKNTEIDILCSSIIKIMDSSLDTNRGINKLMEMGFNTEDYPVETGKKGQLWRVGNEYCIQLTDSRNSPRMAYCVLIKITDIPKHVRKMKLRKILSNT